MRRSIEGVAISNSNYPARTIEYHPSLDLYTHQPRWTTGPLAPSTYTASHKSNFLFTIPYVQCSTQVICSICSSETPILLHRKHCCWCDVSFCMVLVSMCGFSAFQLENRVGRPREYRIGVVWCEWVDGWFEKAKPTFLQCATDATVLCFTGMILERGPLHHWLVCKCVLDSRMAVRILGAGGSDGRRISAGSGYGTMLASHCEAEGLLRLFANQVSVQLRSIFPLAIGSAISSCSVCTPPSNI